MSRASGRIAGEWATALPPLRGGIPLGVELEGETIAFACPPDGKDPYERVGAQHRGHVAPCANVIAVLVVRRGIAATLLEKLDRRVVEGEQVCVEPEEADKASA